MSHLAPALRITERAAGDVVILDLDGRLVLDEGDAVFRDHVDRLVAADRIRIVVNMKDVTYMDSAGVGVLIAKLLSIRRKGGDIKLLNLTRRGQRVMTITHLLTVFALYDDEAAAVASFA
jgi:anti-sigma B factor antagonist